MFPPQMPQTPPQAQPGPVPPTGVPPVAATPQVPKIDDTPIPMTGDELAQWWKDIDLAIAARKNRETRWDALLRAYLPADDADAINSNTHFRNTEQKKATLYFRNPDLILTADEPLKDQVQGPDGQVHSAEDVVSIKQAVLNRLLGIKGVDLKRLIDEALFELLQVSGFGPTKIAYEADFQPTPYPTTGQIVPVPIFEEWTWRKFSSKKLLIPHTFKSTRFDEAPWLGFQGVKPLAVAIREQLVPPDFSPNATRDEHVFDVTRSASQESGAADLVEFVEVWYYPALRDASVSHRQLQRRLVLIKGLEQPAKHTRSPYQTLGPDGRLTADSMIGSPIHVFTLRDLSDSAYVPSDAAMTDPLVRQENTWAAQDIKMRDANIPRFVYDERLAEALKKLAAGEVGEGAGVETGLLAQGLERLIAQLPKLEKAQSDSEGRAQIRSLMNETLAIGPNQSGSVNQKVLSATEISTAQATANVRTSAEQNRLVNQVLQGIAKFDALVQRFATETNYVTWVGQDGSRRLSAWNQTVIAGRYAYEAKPDSQLMTDEAQVRQQDIQLSNLLANAPECNRAELLRGLARDFGKDPSKLIQQPPPKASDPPKMGLQFNGIDLDPRSPQQPIVLAILAQQGIQVPPQALQQAQGLSAAAAQAAMLAAVTPQRETEHGGALEGSGDFHPVSKHAGEITGQPPGRGPM